MQSFEPKAWISGPPQHEHAVEATPKALSHIVEYRPNYSSQTALAPTHLPEISTNERGEFSRTSLETVSSRYPVNARNDWSSNAVPGREVVKQMHFSGLRPDGKSHPPALFALWDAIGVTHELANYRNQTAGWIKQYGAERELQISAMHAIDGAQKAVELRAAAFVDHLYERSSQLPKHDLDAREIRAISLHRDDPVQLRQELDTIEAERQRRFARHTAAYAARRKEAVENAWPQFEADLNRAEINAFRKNYLEVFLPAADALIDRRTGELVKWIKHDLLVDTLEDYSQEPLDADDGVAFEEVVGESIFGITSSANGGEFIDGWIKADRVDKVNLVLRALAANQAEGIEALDSLLKAAIQTATVPLGEQAHATFTNVSKHLAKLGSVTYSSLKLWNSNHKSGVDRAHSSRGLDKIFMTVRERLFANKGFAAVVDSVGMAVMRGVVLVRAGVEHALVMQLLATEAKHALAARGETQLRLKLAQATVSANHATIKKARAELEGAWAKLRDAPDLHKMEKGVPSPAFNEVLDMRFSIVSALLQLTYVTSLHLQNSPDPKVQDELTAAKLTLGAGLADLTSVAIKGASGAETAKTFITLKLAGGVLSGAAAFYTAKGGVATGIEHWKKERYAVATLYFFKSTADSFAGAATFAVSIGYAKPVMDALAKRYKGALMARAVAVVGWSVRMRAHLLLWGMRFNFFSLGVTAVVTVVMAFLPSKMSMWCRECAFSGYPGKRYKDAEKQMKDYHEALADA
ncbi:hypothetical protein OOT46_02480 [Aquabacterium sp. A7-Y]|nr:hypothetical protein [Aquabacterium sp. A7-Y]